MNTSVINIKTSSDVKAKARQVADELGFNLSSLINAYLRQLIKTKTIFFSLTSEEPTEYFFSMLRESKEDVKEGRVSPTFTNTTSAIAWLNKQRSKI